MYVLSVLLNSRISWLLLRVEEHRTRHQKRIQIREIYSQIISTWKFGCVEVWRFGSVKVWQCGSVEVWMCGSVEVW